MDATTLKLKANLEFKIEELEKVILITEDNIECLSNKDLETQEKIGSIQCIINTTEYDIEKLLKKRKPTAEDKEELENLKESLYEDKAQLDFLNAKLKGYKTAQDELKETNYQRQEEELKNLKEELENLKK